MKGEEKLRIIESSSGKKLHFQVNPFFHKYTQEVFLASNSQAVSHSHGSWNEVPNSWFLSASREAVASSSLYPVRHQTQPSTSEMYFPAFLLPSCCHCLDPDPHCALPWTNSGSFYPDVWLPDSSHTGLFSVRLQNHPVQNNNSDHILFPLKNSVGFLLSLR